MTEWSRFDIEGWEFIAYMPDNETESQQWTVSIVGPNGFQRAIYVPMDYAPIFGPDVSDIERLNIAVEEFIISEGIQT